MATGWDYSGVLPDDPELLWRFAGASSRETFEQDGKNQLVLSEFERIELEDGTRVLVHRRLAEHYQKQAGNYVQRCEAAAKSAARPNGVDSETPPADVDEVASDGEREPVAFP